MTRIPGRVYDIAFFAGIIAFVLLLAWTAPPIHAAPIAKAQEPGCTQFAKAGMWDIYHCVDENGNEFEANSAGMMISVGN